MATGAPTDSQLTGREVSGRALLGVLGRVKAAGHDPEALLRGLPFSVGDLRRSGSRIDWSDFTEAWVRVEKVLGGDPGMEQMAVDLVETSFVLRILARVFLTPKQFYLNFIGKMGRTLYSNMRSSMTELDDDRVVWEARLLPGYAWPLSFGAATRGLLRSYTRLLDLPEATVEGTCTDTRHSFVVTLPPPRTLAASWARLASPPPLDPSMDPQDPFEVATPEELANLLETPAAPPGALHDAGVKLLESPTLNHLTGGVLELLERHFLVRTAVLWCASPDGSLSLSGAIHSEGGASVHHSRDLVVGGRHVGRIDVDGAVLHPASVHYEDFETLLPWIAMAVARLLRASQVPDAGVEEAARGARLTSRETDVLRWIREGKTDHEIATILGISHRTVQTHVGRILEKMGVETRLAAARHTFELD